MAEPDAAGAPGGDYPVFSVSQATHEMSTRRTGAPAGRFRAGYIVGTLLTAVVCAITVFAFLLALTREDTAVWWLAAVLIAGSILSLVSLYALGASLADEFHRVGVGVWTCLAAFGAGLFVAGWWLLVGTDLLSDDTAARALPYVVEPTVVGAAAAAIGVVGAAVSVRRSHRDAATAHAPLAVVGTIVSVPAPSGWDEGCPRFADVMVAYPEAGGEQTLAVTMRTTPARVPVEGSSVQVSWEPGGRIRVQRDPDRPLVFDAETAEYEDPGPA